MRWAGVREGPGPKGKTADQIKRRNRSQSEHIPRAHMPPNLIAASYAYYLTDPHHNAVEWMLVMVYR